MADIHWPEPHGYDHLVIYTYSYPWITLPSCEGIIHHMVTQKTSRALVGSAVRKMNWEGSDGRLFAADMIAHDTPCALATGEILSLPIVFNFVDGLSVP